MTAAATSRAFDQLAERYDTLWSDNPIGRQQRSAVWRRIHPVFCSGDRVLDLGCGTGVDACHLMARGIDVFAIDASAEMVRLACQRGIDAHQIAIEDLASIGGRFDGAISNFGALNCVPDLQTTAAMLARLVRGGGHLAICLAGCCSAWEVIYYLRQGKPGKAFRRWRRAGVQASLGIHVWYPGVHRMCRAFSPHFRLQAWWGIGLCVPPSYVKGLSETTINRLAAADWRLAHLPVLRGLADHRLLLFERA